MCDSNSRLSSVIAKFQSSWTFGWSSSVSLPPPAAPGYCWWESLCGLYWTSEQQNSSRWKISSPFYSSLLPSRRAASFPSFLRFKIMFFKIIVLKITYWYLWNHTVILFSLCIIPKNVPQIWIKYDKVDLNTWSFTCNNANEHSNMSKEN